MPNLLALETDFDFEDDSLCNFAMQLFRMSGHTFHQTALVTNHSIKEFIYLDYPHKQVMTPDDWSILNNINRISWLFSNDKKYFCNYDNLTIIDYFAIELSASDASRSWLAYNIHKIFAKIGRSAFTIIIFKVNHGYMITWAYRNRERQLTVVLSDWFCFNDVIDTDIVEKIDAAQFSNQSGRQFFFDFIYGFGRQYYIHPESREFIEYELFPQDFFSNQEFDFLENKTIKAVALANYQSPQNQYQNDYIEVLQDESIEQWFGTDDIDLLKLGMDLEMENLTAQEEGDSDIRVDDSSDSKENKEFVDELDGVEVEIFKDPIRVIKWIETHFG